MENIAIYFGLVCLLIQIAAFVIIIRNRSKQQEILALGTELLAVAVNGGITWYYNQLPGAGETPGLTYFGCVVIGMGLTGVGLLILFVTLILCIVHGRKK